MDHDKSALENEKLEIRLFFEAIYQKYGYDFRDYSKNHLKRRLDYLLGISGIENISQLTRRIIYDPPFFEDVLLGLSINVTEMFRDPDFYRSIRSTVIPHLQTYPFIKVWHAGCAAGQEVYSMAILLEEAGMHARTQIYATDFNPLILEKAKDGIYPIDKIRTYTANYQNAGGNKSFANYYSAGEDSVYIKSTLRNNMLFSMHNLATDGPFGEMNIIFCRNVLIYFNEKLQNRVLKLFFDSLCPGGFLCLGSKESLRFSDYENAFEVIDEGNKIYKKVNDPRKISDLK